MKSVKNQYIDLKEGKMTEAQFMRNVRMTLPQYISNITLFKQAERILINKGIISEIKAPIIEALNSSDEAKLEKIVSKHVKDADDISKEMNAYSEKGFKGFSDLVQANLNRDDEFKSWVQRTNDENQFRKETSESLNEAKLVVLSNEILDFLEERGIINSNDAQKVHKDLTAFLKELGIKEETEEIPGFEGTLNALDKISLREAFKIKDSYDGYYNQDGKEQYSHFDELDNMNAQEVMAGYVMEKIDNPNIDINEATKLIIKNLNKDPYYYTNYKLTGVRGEKPVEFTSDKRKPGFDQTEEVSKNGDNLKDTKNAEKVLKEGYKLLSNPSKVKLKELVRKMMKEMFDGRDNMTDVTGENN